MKLAFIGTGKIIEDALYSVSVLDEIEKEAIYARPHSKEKGEALSIKYGIKKVYTDYDELLMNSGCDAVYIGLINSAHFSYAKRALLSGKHVILEKPFTGFYEEALELKNLAEEKNLYALEAVTILHGGLVQKMKENLSLLGKIRMFLGNYSQYSSRYDEYLLGEVPHAFDKAYYGGALFDINIYNIHFCASLFGEPKACQYFPNIGPNGIDTSGTLVLSYDGFSCVCTGTKDSDSPGFIQIQGEKGFISMQGKPNIAEEMTVNFVDPDSNEKVRDKAGSMVRKTNTITYKKEDCFHRMTPEFQEFSNIIDTKNTLLAKKYMDESIIAMHILEMARISAGIEFES